VPSKGETRSGGTEGSHPGQWSRSVSSEVRPISHSHRELREPGGGTPGGVPVRWDRGTHWNGSFSGPVSKGEALLWGKVQPIGAFPLVKRVLLRIPENTTDKGSNQERVVEEKTRAVHVPKPIAE